MLLPSNVTPFASHIVGAEGPRSFLVVSSKESTASMFRPLPPPQQQQQQQQQQEQQQQQQQQQTKSTRSR